MSEKKRFKVTIESNCEDIDRLLAKKADLIKHLNENGFEVVDILIHKGSEKCSDNECCSIGASNTVSLDPDEDENLPYHCEDCGRPNCIGKEKFCSECKAKIHE